MIPRCSIEDHADSNIRLKPCRESRKVYAMAYK